MRSNASGAAVALSASRGGPALASRAAGRQPGLTPKGALQLGRTQFDAQSKQLQAGGATKATKNQSQSPSLLHMASSNSEAEYRSSHRALIVPIAEDFVDASSFPDNILDTQSSFVSEATRSSSKLARGSSGLSDMMMWRHRTSSFGGSCIAPGLRLLMEQLVRDVYVSSLHCTLHCTVLALFHPHCKY